MKVLEKVIRDAVAADKYKSGVKEVLQSVKGTKLIIVSKSIDSADRAKLEEQAKAANVAVYEYHGTSVQLGKLCNKPFRITAIAIKSGTAAEIEAIMAEKEAAAAK
ncbi:MAG: ribosomal L7Ae/L30e/S12e/Gadd45 family protein [Nitrososphaera sp.]|uniref:50S ribosomal protein L30e n=2 Tax=Candidatus Nitrososphaera gargensis TaxID=497727 RepID=K0I766_NITGG